MCSKIDLEVHANAMMEYSERLPTTLKSMKYETLQDKAAASHTQFQFHLLKLFIYDTLKNITDSYHLKFQA